MDTRRTLALWAMMTSVAITPAVAASLWETDFEQATDAAKASNRYMLLDFSGSDWCGWCIRLDDEVFSKKDFKDYAEENLVCVLLDFPRRHRIKKALKEQNQKLAEQFGVNGFPTVIVLSPTGDVVLRTGYQEGGAEEYVKHLSDAIDPHREKNKVPDPTPIAASQPATRSSLSLSSQRPKPLARDENREVRTWTSKSGTTVTAAVLEERGPYVILKREDATTFQILASKLSDDDRAYIEGLKQEDAAPPEDQDAGE